MNATFPDEVWLEWGHAIRHWLDCDPEDGFAHEAKRYVPAERLEAVEAEANQLAHEAARESARANELAERLPDRTPSDALNIP